MRRIITAGLIVAACDHAVPAPDTPSAAPAAAATPDTAVPRSPARPDDWGFLGPADATSAAAIRQRHARLAKYLQAESEDGELHVDEADVEALLELAGSLLQEQVGQASRRALADDGQRFVRAAWLRLHGREASEGAASLVRIPIDACVGWGCEVPSAYVAADCFGPAVVFVQPVDPHGVLAACERCLGDDDDDARLACMDTACHVVVDGYFTGRTHAAPSSEAQCSDALEFRIRSVAPTDAIPYDLVIPAGETPS